MGIGSPCGQRGMPGQFVHAVFEFVIDPALERVRQHVRGRPVIFHDLDEKHLGQSVPSQGRHGDPFTFGGEAHAAIRLVDQISALVEALDHRRNRLRGGVHVLADQRKGHLLMILLQAVDLNGIAPHGGADGHETPEFMDPGGLPPI
ncbi:MAG: hypothetical protein MZV64_17225 [Ignavibacteriales bacterium]|nr:hypothetical protein [Ignavibacteriales bacterium]